MVKYEPYWNEECREMSNQIFLPIPQNLEISDTPKMLDTTYFDSKFEYNCIDHKSDFILSHPFIFDDEPYVLRTFTVLLFLNVVQKICVIILCGTYRYFYNM